MLEPIRNLFQIVRPEDIQPVIGTDEVSPDDGILHRHHALHRLQGV